LLSNAKSDAAPPGLSVVIPTANRPEALRRCLLALSRAADPGVSWEVIVVDDGSLPPVDLTETSTTFPSPLRLLRIAHQGAAAARNAGLAEARYQTVLFTDDDCVIGDDALVGVAGRVTLDAMAMILGDTRNAVSDDPYAIADDTLHRVVYAHFNRDQVVEAAHGSSAMAAPRDRLREIGGFDTRFSLAQEDRDLCARWREHGWPVVFAPDWRVDHHHSHTWRSFLAQHFRYGRGAFLYHRSRVQRGESGVRPDFAFYAGLALAGADAAWKTKSPLIAALPLAACAATLAGYLRERREASQVRATT